MISASTSPSWIEAARAEGLAEAETQVDVATFIAWGDADRSGDSELAGFYLDRFRAEFKPAFDALSAKPVHESQRHRRRPSRCLSNQVAAQDEVDRLDGDHAGASAADVRHDLQRASNYVLTVVLCAVSLFFAGMSTNIATRRLNTVMVVSG